MSDLRKILIDGRGVEVDPSLTLIEACEIAGVEIPRFYYHERLSDRRQLPHVPRRDRRRADRGRAVAADSDGAFCDGP